jgi:hypothetical protein
MPIDMSGLRQARRRRQAEPQLGQTAGVPLDADQWAYGSIPNAVPPPNLDGSS